jgi:hypothetical protein
MVILSSVMMELNNASNSLKVVKIARGDNDFAKVTLVDVDNITRRHNVNLQNHRCLCRKWQLIGKPCSHVGMKTGRVPGTGTGYGYQNGTDFRIQVFLRRDGYGYYPDNELLDMGRIWNRQYPINTRKYRVGYGHTGTSRSGTRFLNRICKSQFLRVVRPIRQASHLGPLTISS